MTRTGNRGILRVLRDLIVRLLYLVLGIRGIGSPLAGFPVGELVWGLEAEVPPCGGHLLASCRSRCLRYGCQRRCLAAFSQILGSEQGGVRGEITVTGSGRPGLPLPTISSTPGVGAW